MSKIAVCGLVNYETTVPVGQFPIEYTPVNYRFFGIGGAPSGVGLNLSLALKTLGDDVRLCSLVGDDVAAQSIRRALTNNGISDKYVLQKNKETARSVILYDTDGRRSVYTDLTDNQERSYDTDSFDSAVGDCSLVCLCNINYSRPLLNRAKEKGIKIATDVHCVGNIFDEYNRDFMKAADVLFLSNESIEGAERDFVCKLATEYDPEVIAVGLGSRGALLYVRNGHIRLIPAVSTRPVVNTVGAGDSLFSAFVHYYAQGENPYFAMKKAVLFASYKIGDSSASGGFLTEAELEALALKHEDNE